jgi:hypothetical protein
MYTFKADKWVAVHFNLKKHDFMRDVSPLRKRLIEAVLSSWRKI